MDATSKTLVAIWMPELEREFLEQRKPLYLLKLVDPVAFDREQREHEAFLSEMETVKASDPETYYAAIKEWSHAAAAAFASRGD